MSNYPNASIRHMAPMPVWAAAAIIAVAAWFLTTHYLHVFSEVINWDEFALLERADRSVRFGTIVGAGRPGLVTIVLMPFVKGCIDATRSVVEARLLWQVITLVYLAGVYFLVRRWFIHAGRPDEGRVQGLLAVALLAFLPAFVVWSVQVRTDQAALAAAVWGGFFLLSTGYWQAALAGALFGISLLCTQKGIYPIVLFGAMLATASVARAWSGPAEPRSELVLAAKRLAIAGLGAFALIGTYLLLVPEATKVASQATLMSALDTMRFTRAGQGYRIYTVHAPRLVVHWVLFAALVLWSARIVRNREKPEIVLLATSWLALLLGLATIAFHGSSFPYFIMTAGLFPALALAMAAGRPIAMAGRWSWFLVVLTIALAALQSGRESVQMLYDTQREQRDTLRLVYDSPLRDRRGYQVEGALLCMRDPEPLPVLFSAMIWNRFHDSPQAAENTANFIKEFRSRPIAYIVDSYRLRQFPAEVRSFWSEHYLWYAHSLYVAGYNVKEPRDIDIVVPGRYRWDADAKSPAARLTIGSQTLRPGDSIDLAVGVQRVEIVGAGAIGQLILADLPKPQRDGYPFFYHHRQILQLDGRL